MSVHANNDAERALLACGLLRDEAAAQVFGGAVEAGHFYWTPHRHIFTAGKSLWDEGNPVTALTAIDRLKQQGNLSAAGGENAVLEIVETTDSPADAAYYAEIVVRDARARATQDFLDDLATATRQGKVPTPDEIIRKAQELDGTQPLIVKTRLMQGGQYLLETPERSEPVWGAGGQVLWAKGEPFIITAPQGVGKTTVAQQLALHRCGVRGDEFLGLPVARDDRPVLYVAADRPEQARRSFARMIDGKDRDALDSRLWIWRGPIPVNVVKDPPGLARWVERIGAGSVFIDSLKDLAVGLAEDAVGAAVNQAIQGVIAAGIEVALCHHQKKSQDGRKPRSLDDVYGSNWLTAGAGSVVLLWGKPGDSYVELSHLKQPDTEVGPMEIRHDHERGVSTVPRPKDLVDLARYGITVKNAAQELYETDSPDRNQIERARRKLENLAGNGVLERHDPGQGKPVIFRACDDCRVTPRDPQRDPHTERSRRVTQNADLASQQVTQKVTQGHGPTGMPSAPLKGAANPDRDPQHDNGEVAR